ncbi:pseudoazurin [Pelagibacterium sp. 26DY04]|uniref:pseudoazurin n=1 Tax=Pelagibacterium sp. 26DY04 TaxID=2967130 RepID=UPI002815E349|nr:pseudoazurin [Pelagibacterium sp. 26DY04]WMT85365.1 pseudoazurin [Pelagibacterium sp. 26DY04]
MRTLKTFALATALAVSSASVAVAADHQIEMLDQGSDGEIMVFEPAFLEIEPGDTVTFVPTDPYHNAATIEGMIPEGAEPFTSELSEEVTITFDVPGVYGIRCDPHYMMGMVAMIVVGDPVNLEEAQQAEVPEGAQGRIDALFAQVEAQ